MSPRGVAPYRQHLAGPSPQVNPVAQAGPVAIRRWSDRRHEQREQPLGYPHRVEPGGGGGLGLVVAAPLLGLVVLVEAGEPVRGGRVDPPLEDRKPRG